MSWIFKAEAWGAGRPRARLLALPHPCGRKPRPSADNRRRSDSERGSPHSRRGASHPQSTFHFAYGAAACGTARSAPQGVSRRWRPAPFAAWTPAPHASSSVLALLEWSALCSASSGNLFIFVFFNSFFKGTIRVKNRRNSLITN